MNAILFLMFSFTVILIALIGIIAFKIVKKKQLPDCYYTPFDYITGQTTVEFHEEKEEEEEENGQGDDKDKNLKKLYAALK
ncbi:DUF3951 domain-containing protein [Paenibacillus sp. KQZ6P-2]|uniref:DUF3951 domain-containing protein n=1 Tax=Paenibacillus mangrovi TaxID=2931978 RepID=A0A9X2B676_9BACL|nr:DUF3951 domain-containing protein [Paenibacillus mangrovi]MCJ8012423.1 DUF3951 domain-containing protein [Paenibacillus mangrovi]